jgi:hypothetical protein
LSKDNYEVYITKGFYSETGSKVIDFSVEWLMMCGGYSKTGLAKELGLKGLFEERSYDKSIESD